MGLAVPLACAGAFFTLPSLTGIAATVFAETVEVQQLASMAATEGFVRTRNAANSIFHGLIRR